MIVHLKVDGFELARTLSDEQVELVAPEIDALYAKLKIGDTPAWRVIRKEGRV